MRGGPAQEVREAFVQYLSDMGYTEKSIRRYRRAVNYVAQFMSEHGVIEYSSDIGKAFLADIAVSGQYTSEALRRTVCSVRRFDCFVEGRAHVIVLPNVNWEIPPQFAEGMAGYLDYMKTRGLRESTIQMRRENLQKALRKFDAAGIQCFSEIKPEHIYDAFEKTSDKRNFCPPMRGLLRYLHSAGNMDFDYSAIVPVLRSPRPVPSVYTAAETGKLLDSTETDVAARKRNGAIILLALRLGMRSSDIANLKITDVDFASNAICFIQQKTTVPQRLELLPDVKEALISYITTARLASDIPNVFIALNAPARAITTNSVYWLVSSRFKKSGVDTCERKRGGHSLRMTLASELVAEKVPYDAVRKILGHEDPSSAKHYVQFDIESLRSCSIETPPVAGKLAAYMGVRTGGGAQ